MLLGSLEGQNYALIPCILEVCRADNIIESNGYGFCVPYHPRPVVWGGTDHCYQLPLDNSILSTTNHALCDTTIRIPTEWRHTGNACSHSISIIATKTPTLPSLFCILLTSTLRRDSSKPRSKLWSWKYVTVTMLTKREPFQFRL